MKTFGLMIAGAMLATGFVRVIAAMAVMAAEAGLGGYKVGWQTFAYSVQAPVKVVRSYRSLPGTESRWRELRQGLFLSGVGSLLLLICSL